MALNRSPEYTGQSQIFNFEIWVTFDQGQRMTLTFDQGGESRGFNGRVHGISCRYSDKTCKKMNYISINTYPIIMQ